ATSGASSGCAARSVKTSGNELIECVREGREVRELARRRRARTLAEAVDPDGAETELGRGRNVVIQARGNVDVAALRCAALLEEPLPVAGRRLVRADLA